MKHTNRFLTTAAVSIAALVTAMSGAEAAGFALREQSATAQGLSFAGVASGSGGLSSMFWNPATVTMKPGWQSEWHASLVIPQGDITPLAGTSPLLLPLGPSGDFGQTAVIPSSYTSMQINDTIWIGLSSSAPFGLATKSGPAWAGENYATTTKIMAFNVNPIVGLKLTDWLSIAGGPALQYADLTVKREVVPRAFLPPGVESPDLRLGLDDIAFGFTAGANITPWAGTSIGVGFRSKIRHELEGDLRISANPFGIPTFRSAELGVTTPEMVTVGLSQYIGAGVTVHAGYEWTNWSRLKTPLLVQPGIGLIDPFPLNWKDGHFYSVGLEYQFTPEWTLRAGLAYEESPVTTATRHPRLPDNDRIWASLGIGYKWSEKLSFDLSYSHLFIDKTPIRIVDGHQDLESFPTPLGDVPLPFVAEAEAQIDIVSLAVKYRWDDPRVAAAAVPRAPIVRKY
jgi:long-chain fatty acid transport protein